MLKVHNGTQKSHLTCWNTFKEAISDFGLSMLMFILHDYEIFIEVILYLHDNKLFKKPIKCGILRPTALFTNKAKQAFFINCVIMYCFYDVKLTTSPLDRPITAEFTKGFSCYHVTLNILCLCNDSNNNHYVKNYSKNNLDLCSPMIN